MKPAKLKACSLLPQPPPWPPRPLLAYPTAHFPRARAERTAPPICTDGQAPDPALSSQILSFLANAVPGLGIQT